MDGETSPWTNRKTATLLARELNILSLGPSRLFDLREGLPRAHITTEPAFGQDQNFKRSNNVALSVIRSFLLIIGH